MNIQYPTTENTSASKEFILKQDLINLQAETKRRCKVMLILIALVVKAKEIQNRSAASQTADGVKLVGVTKVFLFGGVPSWLKSSLEEEGFSVISCRRPEDGLERLKEAGLIIMADDNEWMCMAIRGLSDAPIVILGFDADAKAWDKALAMGIDAYLSRYLGRRELMARVRAILRRYNQVNLARYTPKGIHDGTDDNIEARARIN